MRKGGILKSSFKKTGSMMVVDDSSQDVKTL